MPRQVRRALFILGIFCLAAFYKRYLICWPSPKFAPSAGDARARWRSLDLTEEQCRVEFPGLEREIDNAVAEGEFELKKEREDVLGSIQGQIKDGKVCIFLREIVFLLCVERD
jgi:hypothetical protein